MPRELIDTGTDKRYVRRDSKVNSRKVTTLAAVQPPTRRAMPRTSRNAAKVIAGTDD